MEDLTRETLAPALRAWTYASGAGEPLAESLPLALAWLRACWDDGGDDVPLFAALDLGLILLRGRDFRFASATDLPRWPEPERAGRLAWEDQVLGRWALDPTVREAHVTLAGTPPAQRARAVAHAVHLGLRRALAAMPDLPRGNPAHLRALGAEALKSPPARFDDWESALTAEWRAWGLAQRDAVAQHLSPGRLFHPEDLWELAHLAELPSESARLALREVNALAAAIGPCSPATARAVRVRAQEVPVDDDDADRYPAGGFDAVATRGSFENMVRTEVVYVGEGAATPGGVDLFDVRFAESELLFYTRDESPLFDARRVVTVVFDAPAAQRVKHPAHPAQALVMANAVALALQADLLRIFGPAGSHTRIRWLARSPEDLTAAEEESALLGLVLAADIAHRRADLAIARTADALPGGTTVVLSPRGADPALPHHAWVRTDEAVWSLGNARFALGDAPTDLRALTDQLLAAVTRPGSKRSQD